ncbi:hypothetical protein XPU_2735 [Xanthomonas arboricola pv. pruni str. MAFF 311562]|uniref:Uncharacterized protein n=1 Tax=Xanthomonas arboricola pv. pruni str. MAFF 311562 TaxID=1414836 RepID=W4S4W8_9XANT|nr:hypothetical protein XPU_2735 [Xanthomonas arboricola pv. pruni str. MAFF 311562]GAE61011.1 hypothetical protein XPN_2917 [Xanthomonas arboricola pv. pruni MAFF 301427]
MQHRIDLLRSQQFGQLGRAHIHAMEVLAETHQVLQMVEYALGGVAQIIDNAYFMATSRRLDAGM